MVERKNFSETTKIREWLTRAGPAGKEGLAILGQGKKPKTMPKSKCRAPSCKTGPLTWGSRTYEFDHKDNNRANNAQSNCYLVCKNCHGQATKTKVIKTTDNFGQVAHKTIKLKVGYKKPIKKAPAKKAKKKVNINAFGIEV
jgi:hypothetical protein